MSPRLATRLLRSAAVVIAALAAFDPALPFSRGPARLAVIAAPGAPGSAVKAVSERLSTEGAVTHVPDPDADAWVLVGGAAALEPLLSGLRPGIMVSAVLPDQPARAVRLLRVEAPERIHRDSRVRVTADLHGWGLQGTTSTIVVRAGALELARASHRWTRKDERTRVTLDVLLPDDGPNLLRVEVIDAPHPPVVHDRVVVADGTRLAVLLIEGRPSWTATFLRRALGNDPRLDLTVRTVIAKGVTARRGSPPAAFDASSLDAFGSVVVGAPEALRSGEVEALRAFARRGGSLVLVPDTAAAGPYRDLVPAGRLEERLLEEPARVALTPGGGTLLASEVAIARDLSAGADVLGGVAIASKHEPVVVGAPAGAGYVVYAGTLDGWRFRDREAPSFDLTWTALVHGLAVRGRDRVVLRVVPNPALPGTGIAVRLDHPAASPEAGTRVRAEVAGLPARLWPDGAAGVFVGRLAAPREPGVYALTAEVATDGPAARTAVPLVVSRGAASAAASEDALQSLVEASGGLMVESGRIERLVRHHSETRSQPALTRAGALRPMRSPWWLLVLCACLGGEWYLRRRQGLR